MFARVNGVSAAFALIGAVGIAVTLSAAALPVEDVAPVEVAAVELAFEVPEVEPVEVEPVAEVVAVVEVEPVEVAAEPAPVVEEVAPIVVDVSGLPAGGALALPPCEVEDATNCYWNAAVAGNGVGRSFIDVGGVTYYAAN